MVEIIEPIYIPMVGGYDAGAHVELDEKLEQQLIASGKAKPSKRKTEKEAALEPADVIAHPAKGFEPGLTDD